jgi:cell division protein FtsL
MEMLMSSQVKLIFIAAGVSIVVGVVGTWSTWVTRTLVTVDKTTAVMSTKLDINHSMLAVIVKNLSIERVKYVNVRD